MRIRAPAKINLFLEILDKRKDGYHPIRTVFQTVGLYDDLEIEKSRGKGVTLELKDGAGPESWIEVPPGHSNIALRAGELYIQKFKPEGSFRITLQKRIPVQAGLGGGSADAAAVLKAMSRLSTQAAAPSAKRNKDLLALALKLGADVPFFLKGGCARAGGVGERISPLEPPPGFWAVIFKPEVGCSTKEVYGWYDSWRAKQGSRMARMRLTSLSKLSIMANSIRENKPPQEWCRYLFNRFERIVFSKIPELERIKRAMINAGAIAAILSGSGSSLVAIVSGRREGERIAERMKGFSGKSYIVESVGAQEG